MPTLTCLWAPIRSHTTEYSQDGTDPHDYIATSVYAWPNATSSDGLPWVVIDGKYNPDLGADNTALANFAKAIRELSVGYYITGSESYAQKADQPA